MKKYASLPTSAVFSLGGFTCFKTDEWGKYLQDTILRYHPWYFFRHYLLKQQEPSSESNDCVIDSLRKYLLCEFGILLPEHTIFKVYNQDGQGILPEQLVDAISAIIEPLGLEIDQIIVPNAELRQGLACPEKTVDASFTDRFNDRPGICMINISKGKSHAFFWKRMDAEKFSSPQFRMALLVRNKQSDRPTFSPIKGLEEFAELVREYLKSLKPGQSGKQILAQVDKLLNFTYQNDLRDCDDFHSKFDYQLDAILVSLAALLEDAGHSFKQGNSVLVAGHMVRTIFERVEAY